MKRLTAVIFDMDDTLYPERDFVLSGFQAAATWMEENHFIDASAFYTALAGSYEQGIRGDNFARALAQFSVAAEGCEADLVRIYRSHDPNIRPYAGTIAVLDQLHGPYRLGLVSDGFLDVQRRKFAALGIQRYFDAVVFSDEFGREHWKPSVKPFQAVLERLQVGSAQSAVYIGDNPTKDFLGANQMGMTTIQIRRPDSEYAVASGETDDHRPAYVVDHWDQLIAVLSHLAP